MEITTEFSSHSRTQNRSERASKACQKDHAIYFRPGTSAIYGRTMCIHFKVYTAETQGTFETRGGEYKQAQLKHETNPRREERIAFLGEHDKVLPRGDDKVSFFLVSSKKSLPFSHFTERRIQYSSSNLVSTVETQRCTKHARLEIF